MPRGDYPGTIGRPRQPKICPKCHGSGERVYRPEMVIVQCTNCSGSGIVSSVTAIQAVLTNAGRSYAQSIEGEIMSLKRKEWAKSGGVLSFEEWLKTDRK